MRGEGTRRWTLILLRAGEVESRRMELTRARAVALAGTLIVLLAGAFFFAGRWTGGMLARGRVAELEGEVSTLQAEKAALAGVADRVVRLESEYRRLRAVMGGELGVSRRDILLPPLSEDDADARRAAAEDDEAGFVWPVVGRGFVTRVFEDTTTVPTGEHLGVDIAVPVGSYVRAARGGVVREAGDDAEYGLFVRVEHDGDMSSLYAHNSWLFVARGDSVEIGEVIGLSGNSGRSTAPHLHVEMSRQGVIVDPLEYLAEGT